jgi:hypothetical protein
LEQQPTFPVIAFDARVPLDHPSLEEPNGWRLKETPRSLSVDESIWWSALDENLHDLPEWRGARQNNWESLEVMRACAQSNGVTGYLTLAITQMPDDEDGAIGSDVTEPNAVQPAWQFLGYDVADYFLLSGLTNCGPVNEADPLGRFAAALNEHHLFDNIQAAEQFALISDERVPEHAPFYVYGLYLVP